MVFLIITFSIPAVQTKLARQVTDNLNEDFGTNLKISKVDLSLLGSVSLKGIEIKDHHQDTLIYVERLRSSLLDIKRILENNIQLNNTSLKGVHVYVKNYKGEAYDLEQFIDSNTYFVTTKTKYGQKLKTLERPGLWNGSMADWNTIFVEVPIITFNPVKTVNDLLKFTHQVK